MAQPLSNAPTSSPFGRIRELLAPERPDLLVILLYVAAVGLLSLIVPVTIQALVNTASFGTLLQPLVILALLVFVVLGAAGIMRVLQVVVAERLQQRIFARMAVDVAYRLPRVRLEAYDTVRGTELVNRFFDVLTIQKSMSLILLDGAAIVLQTAIGLILLALYHPFLLGFDVLLLGAMLFVVFGLGRGAVRTSVAESYAKYDMVAWLEELARAPLAFRLSGGAQLALRHADDAAVQYLARRQAHFRILLRQIGGTLAVQAIASAALLGIGGLLVSRAQLTLGQLVAAELIVTPAVGSFAKFGKYLETFYELLAAVDKVGHLFDLPLSNDSGETLPQHGPYRLAVRNLGLKRNGRSVLADITLHVEAGQRVSVLGRSASGKSAFAELITGQRHPDTGTLTIEDIDLRHAAAESLRERVALVRGGDLFDGTLRDNLRLDRHGVEAPKVAELLRRLSLLDEIETLPAGLETEVGGTLSCLSSGQALRLALARALLGRPGLLVLDETLDPLDEAVRENVLEVLLEASAPWTLVVITRLPEVARRLDRVITIERGRLAEPAEIGA